MRLNGTLRSNDRMVFVNATESRHRVTLSTGRLLKAYVSVPWVLRPIWPSFVGKWRSKTRRIVDFFLVVEEFLFAHFSIGYFANVLEFSQMDVTLRRVIESQSILRSKLPDPINQLETETGSSLIGKTRSLSNELWILWSQETQGESAENNQG